MNATRTLAGFIWGAFAGAFLGCLAGLAEFAFVFLKSGDSYSGSLPLAYRHIVYPHIVLGLLTGLIAAGCALVIEWIRCKRGRPAKGVRVTTFAVLLGLAVLALLAVRIVLVVPRNMGSLGVVTVFVGASLASIAVATIASIAMAGFERRIDSVPRRARALRPFLGFALPAFVIAMLVLPPRLLTSEADSVTPETQSKQRKPHVIFVLVDTLRADHLSLYGYSRKTSPYLERLAESGVVFSQALASSTWTKPSVASLFTSLHPSAHRAKGNQDFLSGSVVTLAEVLRDAGYATLGVTANPLIAPTFGFTQGFMDFHSPETISPFRFTSLGRVARQLSNRLRAAERRDQLGLLPSERTAGVGQTSDEVHAREPRSEVGKSVRLSIRDATTWVAEKAFGERVGALPPGDGITEIALKMAARNRDAQSLFLYVHYIDPHDPYSPPPPFDEAFSHQRESAVRFPGVAATESVHLESDKEWVADNVDLYDGEILFVDDQIGRLFAGLEELGLLEDAIVVVTSDHGEEFLDHGGKTHGRTLYQEVLRVPLIMGWPGLENPGRFVDAPVGLIDLMPTILDLIGVQIPDSISGRSLVSDVSLENDFESKVAYFGEVKLLETARVDDLKIIRNRDQLGSEEIYNLKVDPLEMNNLAENPDIGLDSLRLLLDNFTEATQVQNSSVEQETVSEEEEAMEALRALGYIE